MKQLNSDQLIERACRETGLDRFDAETFREGLDLYIADFNAQPNLFDEAVPVEAGYIVSSLANRLKVTAYLESRPELLQRPIERPVFVCGLPRTGTTLLSNLLACDPHRRPALSWEIDDPVPPPTAATLYNDPRALARLEQDRQFLAAQPDMGKYYRGSAVYPNECSFILIHEFKATLWEGRGQLPNYRDWLYSGEFDMTSAYTYHRKFLQVLQADAPGIWSLKMPSHCLFLDALLTVYPDARIIFTHRDPLTSVGSYCSLMSIGYRSSPGHIDPLWLGENYSWQVARHAERVVDAREKFGTDRIVDSYYAETMRDPIGSMRKLYDALGDEFTPEAGASMRAWLADNPQGKFGRHEYKLAQYGLTVDRVSPMFERYLSCYQIEPEG